MENQHPQLTEKLCDETMIARGYTRTASTESKGKKTMLHYVKTNDTLGTSLHAQVIMESEQIMLHFLELKLACYLSTHTFDFWHKDFDRFEEVMYVYAGLCTEKNVFDILDEYAVQLHQAERKTEAPKKTIEERKREFWDTIASYGKEKQYTKQMCLDFYNYWIQMNDGGKKLRFEIEKSRKGVFDTKGRLRTWKSNEEKFNSKFQTNAEQRADKQNKEQRAVTQVNKKELF